MWELIPERNGFVKLDQDSYLIDTSVANHLNLEPAYFAIEGQFRFFDEQKMDEEIDDLGIRVNGVDFWDFEDFDEVEFEPLFRQFKLWVPFHFIAKQRDLEIQAVSRRSDSAIIFKPAVKTT